MIFKHKRYALLGCLWLAACSGDALNLAEGGIDGTSLGVGPISNFGSIFVNDIEYNTEQAAIFVNDVESNQQALKRGMYVSVEGTQNPETSQGIAQRVEYRDSLRGRIRFIGNEGRTLRLLGQTLQLTDNTFLYGIQSLSELQVGDYIRASGPALTGIGEVQATLLERLETPLNDVALLGLVGALDNTTQSFFLAGIRVNYANTQTLTAELRAGQLVEVVAQQGRNGLDALHIRKLALDALPTGSFVNMRGSVTRFESLQDFDVEFRRMRLSSELAAQQPSLGLGARVRIVGRTNNDGIIELESMQVFASNQVQDAPNRQVVRVSGPLQTIDIVAQQLNVFDVTLPYNANTRFRDISGVSLDNFGVDDLRMGDYVSLAAHLNNGDALVTLVHYEPFVTPDLRQLQGRLTGFDAATQQLEIEGIAVLPTPQTRYFDASQVLGLQLPPLGARLDVPQATEVDSVRFFQQLEGLPRPLVYAFGRTRDAQLPAGIVVILPLDLSPQ